MTSERERNDTGQFTNDTHYEESDFLAAVNELENPTTSDIANRVGCSHDTATRWLTELEQHGDLTSNKIGNSIVWEPA